jgi:phosphoglucosamine mutase
MSRMAQTQSPLATLAAPMQSVPQVLINVAVADKLAVADAPAVRDAVAQAEAELGDTGRILLRPSGTEQIVRVMVEAADEDTARQLAHRVAQSVSAEG